MARLQKARYTREFKIHAVSMARDEGLGIAETEMATVLARQKVENSLCASFGEPALFFFRLYFSWQQVLTPLPDAFEYTHEGCARNVCF